VENHQTFVFGSFRLIPAQRTLLEDGKPLPLGSRALDILVTLVESAGEIIRKDLLIARTWPDTAVDEGALRVHVAALRKVLGDGRAGKRYIVNNAGRGYSFVAPMTREQRQPTSAPPSGAAVSGNLPAAFTRIIGRDDIICRSPRSSSCAALRLGNRTPLPSSRRALRRRSRTSAYVWRGRRCSRSPSIRQRWCGG
jgi:DNA-binding winged helix-turn-helix (wHTH) protein